MSSCSQKVRMVLAQKNIPWTSQTLDLRRGDQFKPEFVKLNPKAVVPVIEHNGKVLTESNAIMEYLEEVFPDRPLMPGDSGDRAIVRKWLIRLDAGLHTHNARISFVIAFADARS